MSAECLAYALTHATVGQHGNRGLGIYGGTNTRQRRAMLRSGETVASLTPGATACNAQVVADM